MKVKNLTNNLISFSRAGTLQNIRTVLSNSCRFHQMALCTWCFHNNHRKSHFKPALKVLF
jgi:hypothetical protein